MRQRRTSLIDKLSACVAHWHAHRVYQRFIQSTRYATSIQGKNLLAKIRRNANSDFGRDHHFAAISNAAEFSRHVPIGNYESHRPYIERVKQGDFRALFGPRQRVLMFALTSGTTEEPKYIPVTQHFLNEYRQGWNAFGIKALLDHDGTILRPIVQVTSRMNETSTSAGIPCGAITGLLAATQKRLVCKYYIAPRCLAEIDDPAAKYYTIMRLAVPADVGFCVTASPATQLKLAQAADTHAEQLIRDVHDGGLWPQLPVSDALRQQLAPRMKADSATARRLEEILKRHGRLLPKHYWNLGFLANWTGGSMSLYLRDIPEYFGDTPVRDIGLLASEGRVSIPIEDGTAAGILDVTSHFFEFVPREEIDQPSPTTLRSHQVRVGEEYFVLLTTSAGLYRYDLRDLVRVVDFFGEAPVVEFLNKGAHISSLTGEKLTERQVVLAMERAVRLLNLSVDNFVLAPRWDRLPYYLLHLTEGPASSSPTGARLAAELDRQLRSINVEYASKRDSDRLGPVRLNVLPPGFLADLDQRQAQAHRRGNEQFKHKFLYTRPGEDDDFPSVKPCLSNDPA